MNLALADIVSAAYAMYQTRHAYGHNLEPLSRIAESCNTLYSCLGDANECLPCALSVVPDNFVRWSFDNPTTKSSIVRGKGTTLVETEACSPLLPF